MRTLFVIAALAAGLVSNVANADTVHRHQRAGAGMRYTAEPVPSPASYQSLYQGGDLSNDCEGQRVFGFCPVR
jgi:hypothetical protein